MAKENLFGAVDLGEDKFVVVAARRAGSSFELVGSGIVDSDGFSAGMITNLNQAGNALTGAVRQAEIMAGAKIEGVVASVSGTHIAGEEKQAHVKIQGGAVTASDVDLALDTLQAFPVPEGLEILHVLEQEYSIDGQGGIQSPLGMKGSLLEADAYVVTARKNALSNLKSCLATAGLELRRTLFSGLATGNEITTADERDLGVVTMDWGGGSCDIAVFQNGAPRLLRTIELGGALIDRDIAKMFRISLPDAKRVKHEIGSSVQVQVDKEASVVIKDAAGKESTSIEPHVLSMIIEARVEEILRKLHDELRPWMEKDKLPAGVIITGGMADLRGIVQMGHDVLGVPVRIGKSSYSGPCSDEVAGPEFAGVLGLLKLWSQHGFSHHETTDTGLGLLGWLRKLFGGSPAPSNNIGGN